MQATKTPISKGQSARVPWCYGAMVPAFMRLRVRGTLQMARSGSAMLGRGTLALGTLAPWHLGTIRRILALPQPEALSVVPAGLHGVAPAAVIQIPPHGCLEAV